MQDITSLRVQNYQSIGDADLRIGGVTVIVGRGNLGKSALLRALTACLFNETGSDFIRRGHTSCEVELGFSGDESVKWIREDKGARYEVDVQGVAINFTKLAGNVPAQLQDLFGVREIEIDKTFSITPQIHMQFDAPLLLTESAGKAARALAKLTKLEVIVTAQMNAARDMRRARQLVTTQTEEVSNLKERLAVFPDLKALDVLMEQATQRLEVTAEHVDRATMAAEAYEAFLAAKVDADAVLPVLPDLGALAEHIKAVRLRLSSWADYEMAVSLVPSWQMITQADEDARKAREELDAFMQSIGVCPVCGQKIKSGHSDD